MRFNAIGTFIGRVNPDKIQPKRSSPIDYRSLQYPVFLASPFLSGAFHKYSGSEETGHNGNNGLGAAVDAFAHHVVVDSGETVLLCDLQGIFQDNNATALSNTNSQAWQQMKSLSYLIHKFTHG